MMYFRRKSREIKRKDNYKRWCKKGRRISAQYTSLIVWAVKKHTNNMTSRSVIMTNKVLRKKSKCSVRLSDKSRFSKQRPDKKSG